jgi:hypothetical protein
VQKSPEKSEYRAKTKARRPNGHRALVQTMLVRLAPGTDTVMVAHDAHLVTMMDGAVTTDIDMQNGGAGSAGAQKRSGAKNSGEGEGFKGFHDKYPCWLQQ